jgi:hypothetical protein
MMHDLDGRFWWPHFLFISVVLLRLAHWPFSFSFSNGGLGLSISFVAIFPRVTTSGNPEEDVSYVLEPIERELMPSI